MTLTVKQRRTGDWGEDGRLRKWEFQKNRGSERGEKQNSTASEGCSLTGDDGFVAHCYITATSENDFYCSEPPNLLPHLHRKHSLFPLLLQLFLSPALQQQTPRQTGCLERPARKLISTTERKRNKAGEVEARMTACVWQMSVRQSWLFSLDLKTRLCLMLCKCVCLCVCWLFVRLLFGVYRPPLPASLSLFSSFCYCI